MRTVTNLPEVLRLHALWLDSKPGGVQADLSDANLYNANLYNANLSNANLRNANLIHANLIHANLRNANLSDADLSDADLSYAKGNGSTVGFYLACPETGAFTAYKRCRDGAIVTLRVPEGAKRSSATTRKCRAEYAEVLAIVDANDTPTAEAVSKHDESVVYRVGETVRPTQPFCEDRWNECASGIHFFITRAEAESYTG